MAHITRQAGRVTIVLDAQERTALLGVTTALQNVIGSGAVPVSRGYDDPDLEVEYHKWVRPDVETSRNNDVQTIAETLGREAAEYALSESDALAWARGLTHLRLAAAVSLGIAEDGWEQGLSLTQQERPEYGWLLALSYIQEELVAALEV